MNGIFFGIVKDAHMGQELAPMNVQTRHLKLSHHRWDVGGIHTWMVELKSQS